MVLDVLPFDFRINCVAAGEVVQVHCRATQAEGPFEEIWNIENRLIRVANDMASTKGMNKGLSPLQSRSFDELFESLSERRLALIHIAAEGSIVLFMYCQTPTEITGLQQLLEGGELNSLMTAVYNSFNTDSEPLKLTTTIRDPDKIELYFNASSCEGNVTSELN